MNAAVHEMPVPAVRIPSTMADFDRVTDFFLPLEIEDKLRAQLLSLGVNEGLDIGAVHAARAAGQRMKRKMFVPGPAGAYCSYGSRDLCPLGGTELGAWAAGLYAHLRAEHPGEIDFRTIYNGSLFRVFLLEDVDGSEYVVRRIPLAPPHIDDLTMMRTWRTVLMHPTLCKGGLVIIAAEAGMGKSTTLASVIHSRLLAFGGRAVTIENPVELPLSGHHGAGVCRQIEVRWDHDDPRRNGFTGALRGVMRAYNASDAQMLMIGEIRDAETASEAVRYANSGMLVLCTVHAESALTAIERILGFAEQQFGPTVAANMIAAALRVAVHQRLVLDPTTSGWSRGRIDGQMIVSDGLASPLANAIRQRDMAQAQHPMQMQKTSFDLAEQRKMAMPELMQKIGLEPAPR